MSTEVICLIFEELLISWLQVFIGGATKEGKEPRDLFLEMKDRICLLSKRHKSPWETEFFCQTVLIFPQENLYTCALFLLLAIRPPSEGSLVPREREIPLASPQNHKFKSLPALNWKTRQNGNERKQNGCQSGTSLGRYFWKVNHSSWPTNSSLPHPKKIHNQDSGFPKTVLILHWINFIHTQPQFHLTQLPRINAILKTW